MNILLVEDHAPMRRALRFLLTSAGYEVVEAENGSEAVRLAAEAGADLALVDLQMPDMNGLEATRRIVSVNPQCRVIVVSAHGERRIIAAAVAAGASGYIPKLSAYDEVGRAIRAVVAGRQYIALGGGDPTAAGPEASMNEA